MAACELCAHNSQAATYGPIPGGYESSINSAGSSARGGGDGLVSGAETLLETPFYAVRLGDTIVPAPSEKIGK